MKKLSIILVCFLVGFATACKEEKAQTPVVTEEAPTEIKVKRVED